MLKLYNLDIRKLNKELLDKKRKMEPYNSMKNNIVQCQKIARDLLFNYMIKKENINSDIVYNEYGKPAFKNSDLFFNISHSGDLVIIALSDEEIGIDVQIMKEIDELKLDRFIKKIYNDDDYNYYNIDDTITFTQIWTIKEAYMKYLGMGLLHNIRDIFIDYEKYTINMRESTSARFCSFVDFNYIVTIVSKEIDKNTFSILKTIRNDYDYTLTE